MKNFFGGSEAAVDYNDWHKSDWEWKWREFCVRIEFREEIEVKEKSNQLTWHDITAQQRTDTERQKEDRERQPSEDRRRQENAIETSLRIIDRLFNTKYLHKIS